MHTARLLAIAAALLAGLGAGACGPSGGGENGNNVNPRDGAVPSDATVIGDSAVGWDVARTDAMEGCDPRNFILQQAPPPAVMLVVDRSGSMLEPGSTGFSRWQELQNAMDVVLAQFASQIQFGLLMYPTGDQCQTPPAQLPPGLFHGAPILHYLSTAQPAGGTPTAAALRNAGQTLKDMAPGQTHFMILATDGAPNCNYLNQLPCACSLSNSAYCCTNYPGACTASQLCLDDDETLQVLIGLGTSGVETFVIGLDGTQEYVETLNAMALAGGRPQTGGATSYYAATNQTELTQALQSIAGSVLSCIIYLEEPPDFPDYVTIYVDGHEVPRDTSRQNGWDYTHPELTEIELFGQACETLQDGDPHQVTATFACVIN